MHKLNAGIDAHAETKQPEPCQIALIFWSISMFVYNDVVLGACDWLY